MEDKVFVLKNKEQVKSIPNFSFIVASNGFFFKKETNVISSIFPVKKLPALANLNPDVKISIPKIEAKELAKAISFFRSKMISGSREAICQVFLDTKKNRVFIDVPEQYCSSTTLVYRPSSKRYCLVIGTIHSHHNMPACHSSTDIKDEKEKEGVHFVVGNLGKSNGSFSMSCVVSSGEFRKPEEPLRYFSGISRVEDGYYIFKDHKIESLTFPKEWDKYFSNLASAPEDLVPFTRPIVETKQDRPFNLDYLDIAGLEVDELRTAKILRIPISKFITIYDGVDEDEASVINRDVLAEYGGLL